MQTQNVIRFCAEDYNKIEYNSNGKLYQIGEVLAISGCSHITGPVYNMSYAEPCFSLPEHMIVITRKIHILIHLY